MEVCGGELTLHEAMQKKLNYKNQHTSWLLNADDTVYCRETQMKTKRKKIFFFLTLLELRKVINVDFTLK